MIARGKREQRERATPGFHKTSISAPKERQNTRYASAVLNMKLISISLVSWLFGLFLLMSLFDISSATVSTLIVAALLFSLAYAPSLFWLRRRIGGCRPALLFPLSSAIILNLPVFLIEILAIGRTLAPAEALACSGAFLLMGTVFGLGFVWKYQDAAL